MPEDRPPADSSPLVRIGSKIPATSRLPGFLRKPVTNFESVQLLKNGLRRLKLHTVCESAIQKSYFSLFWNFFGFLVLICS